MIVANSVGKNKQTNKQTNKQYTLWCVVHVQRISLTWLIDPNCFLNLLFQVTPVFSWSTWEVHYVCVVKMALSDRYSIHIFIHSKFDFIIR